jgi:TP901-1 family phage major tail protein
MSTCNTARNEKGGKDLLLKVCSEQEADLTNASATITVDDHGLEVGDLVRFPTLGALNDVVAMQIYFVVAVLGADEFTISATVGGTAIIFTPGETNLTIETFTTVGGLRSSSFSFSADAIDVSNHGSNQWKQMLDEAGMKSVEISGSGVYTSATNYRLIETNAFANLLTCLAFLDTVSGRIYAGCFKITSIEASAEYDGEASYTLSASSADEVTIYQAA